VKKKWVKVVVFVVLFLGALAMLMPFAWMIMTSFKLNSEVEAWPPRWSSENFSTLRTLNLNLVRSEGVTIDFSALTIEEFFNLGAILESLKTEEKVLTFQIDDDPPYRGVMTLQFDGNGSVRYARSLSPDQAAQLEQIVASFQPLPSDVVATWENMALVDDPIFKLRSFMNFLFFQKNSHLTRRGAYDGFSQAFSASKQAIDSYGSRLVDHRLLQPGEDDSATLTEAKAQVRGFLQKELEALPTRMARFQVILDEFIRGKALLEPKELLQLENDFERVFASTFEIPWSLEEWTPLKLYHDRVLGPLLEMQRTLQLGNAVYAFYDRVQTETLTDPLLEFTFRTQAEITQDLLGRIDGLGLPPEERELLRGIVESAGPEKASNALFRELDGTFSHELETLGVEKKDVTPIASTFKSFISSLGSLLSEQQDLQSQLVGALEKGEPIFPLLEAADISSSNRAVLQDGLQKVRNVMAQYQVPDAKVFQLVATRYHQDQLVQSFTSISSRVLTRMKISQAPDIVENVRYKSLRSVEVAFRGIDPFWFWDDPVQLRVRFSFADWWANIFQNYVNAWTTGKYFGYYYFNTVFVAVATTLLDILFASMAAFAFSKLRFFGRNFLFMLFLATMMVPGEVLLVPNYITLAAFGWIDTYWALIVPWTVSVFVIFLIRQHFMAIPDELYDAGRIDGITKWGFLWKVMVPLSKPVIITGSLLKFVGSWNAFLWVLIVTKSPQVRTLPVGLSTFSSEVGTLYNQLMAASTFSMLPVVILFLFVQKFFIQGIARTGLK